MADSLLLSRRTVLCLPVALAACNRGADVIELSGSTMGTTYSVVAVDHSRSQSRAELGDAIKSGLAEVNAQMSNWDPGSEISRFNKLSTTDAVSASPAMVKVLKAAQDVHAASDGQFDVTLGPLIELWGFGARNVGHRNPSDTAIAAALNRAGQGRVLRVGAGTLQKSQPDCEIYLSAIGKGYGVDRIAQALQDFGIRDYMVEIGGDLYTSGRNPDGRPWQIGIETPDARDRRVQKVVGVSNLGMATSGDYRNYFEKNGVRYSHILDARTGRPITHTTASATVLTETAMHADAWATAMLILGREKGLEIANRQNLAVLFVERDQTSSDLKFKATPSARFAELQA